MLHVTSLAKKRALQQCSRRSCSTNLSVLGQCIVRGSSHGSNAVNNALTRRRMHSTPRLLVSMTEQQAGRAPLPPMPRVFPASAETSSAGKISSFWKSGNLLIFLGWSGVGLLLVDRYLQYTMQRDQEQARGMTTQIQSETKTRRWKLWQRYQSTIPLYSSQVTLSYPMGGSHGLPNVKVGDMLDILEENVGPDGHYHLCRSRQELNIDETTPPPEINMPKTFHAVGWYPIAFMQDRESAERNEISSAIASNNTSAVTRKWKWAFWK